MTQNLDGKEARGLAQSLLSFDGGCEEGDDTIEEGCSNSDPEMEVEDDRISKQMLTLVILLGRAGFVTFLEALSLASWWKDGGPFKEPNLNINFNPNASDYPRLGRRCLRESAKGKFRAYP